MKKNLLVRIRVSLVAGIFFTLIFSMGVITAFSQITLTQSDVASIGDTILIARDTTPNTVSVGGTGLQTWDFTSLQTDVVDENVFVDPLLTFAGLAFPGSNLAMDINSGYQVNYMTADSAGFTADGFWGDPLGVGVPVAIKFDPPSTLMQFPAALSNSFQDTSHFQFFFSDPQLLQFGIDSIMISHYGYATRTMDAYGLMVTPADSFDCLRQFSEEELLDSIFMHPVGGSWMLVPPSLLPPDMGFTNNPNLDTTFTYDWYANGEGMAVAKATLDVPGGNVISASFLITDKIVAGLFSVVDVSCYASCNGSATVTAISGYPPFTYLWDSGAGSQTTADADSLCAGTFSVTITDSFGNQSSASITISEPAILLDSTSFNNAQCDTCANGTASVWGIGGTPPYFFTWSSGQSTASVSNLLPGTYSVTITDDNGCSIVDSVVVGTWPVGIKDGQANENAIRVFPNPSSGSLYLTSGSDEMKSISLFNVIGEMVFNERNPRSGMQLDFSGFESGIYFLKIESGNSSVTKRIHVVK